MAFLPHPHSLNAIILCSLILWIFIYLISVLLSDCLQSSKEGAYNALVLIYYHHFLNIFPATWYHMIGKFFKGGKENRVIVSPIIIKVLHSLAPGGCVNFTGTKLQWITTGADIYIYIYSHMNEHTGIWIHKYLFRTKKCNKKDCDKCTCFTWQVVSSCISVSVTSYP